MPDGFGFSRASSMVSQDDDDELKRSHSRTMRATPGRNISPTGTKNATPKSSNTPQPASPELPITAAQPYATPFNVPEATEEAEQSSPQRPIKQTGLPPPKQPVIHAVPETAEAESDLDDIPPIAAPTVG
jgi:hypothetical protein